MGNRKRRKSESSKSDSSGSSSSSSQFDKERVSKKENKVTRHDRKIRRPLRKDVCSGNTKDNAEENLRNAHEGDAKNPEELQVFLKIIIPTSWIWLNFTSVTFSLEQTLLWKHFDFHLPLTFS